MASKLDLGLCLFRLAYGCSAGAGEVLLWARWDGEAGVPLAGGAGALLDGQGGPTVDPYGGSTDPAIPISSDRFLRLNIGEFSGINLRAEPLCHNSERQKRLWYASPHNDGGVVNV